MTIWLVVSTYPSEKYDFVSWDYEVPNWMESHKIDVPNHQPDSLIKINKWTSSNVANK